MSESIDLVRLEILYAGVSFMADKTKAEKLIDIASESSRGDLAEFLEKGAMPRKQFRSVTQLAKDALYELLSDEPNEKRMKRKLKEAALVFLDLEIESQVDDQLQSRAVKLLRENVIRRAEKEKLAEEVAELAAARWRTLTEAQVERLADDDDGLLALLLEKTEMKLDAGDAELSEAVTEIGKTLSLPFLAALPEAEFDAIAAGAAKVCDLAAAGKPAAEQLQQTATAALESLGVIRAMRKSFAGLLLGDLILRQVGKSLGVKDKVSVTDFIIFLVCAIADNQLLPKADKADLRRFRDELSAL